MIVAFSTSSPLASVALLAMDGTVLASDQREAHHAAGGACLAMLEALLAQQGASLGDVRAFTADLGPGSFTGVKVGVTLAKTLAFANGVHAAGASAFDLIDPEAVVAVPCRKGEYLVRVPGEEPQRVEGWPDGAVGYGVDVVAQRCPLAERMGPLVDRIEALPPAALTPEYVLEPSISLPKRPYGGARG